MKRTFVFVSLLIGSFVFSGCSFGSSNSDGDSVNTRNASLWRSPDGGRSWEPKNGTTGTLFTADILSLAVDPSNYGVVYAGLRTPGILKTQDAGETWNYLKFQSEKVYGLSINPKDSNVIYATGVWQERGKIFKSYDAGENWQEIYTTATSGPLAISLTIDSINPEIIYATTSDNQVIKSSDGGTSWRKIFETESPVMRVAVDGKNNGLVYFITRGDGFYRSNDGGESFEEITEKFSSVSNGGEDFSLLEIDPQNNWIYLAGKGGIIRSKNAGDSWERVPTLDNTQTSPVRALAINPQNSNEIVYGAAQAVYLSVDGGISWIPSQFDTGKAINVLKYDIQDASLIYMGLSK